jgi:dTDP-4-dehydrorhamnose 3,5-epimerase
MTIKSTSLTGVYVIGIEKHEDDRGFFARTWDPKEVKEQNLIEKFDYSCISGNTKKGTLRGMHFQAQPHRETKLVRCTKGSIFDVVIDLRPESTTFKQWIEEELSDENHKALYIPEGCAHGFLSLTDETEVLYAIAGKFNADAATGVRWNDLAFGIKWLFDPLVISERDAAYPDFIS